MSFLLILGQMLAIFGKKCKSKPNVGNISSIFAEKSLPILPSFTDNAESEKQLLIELAKEGLNKRLKNKIRDNKVSKDLL